MKIPKFSTSLYFRSASFLWILIAFGSCFSLGARYLTFDPGEIVSKIAYILMFFLTSYFFIWMARKAKEQEFEMPSDEDAQKIITDFNKKHSRKKTKHLNSS